MKPQIQHLGHAGFAVQGAHGTLLMDPWFSAAILESWFPWPDNSHLKDDTYGNWLYVSHHHEDHFDRKFLTERFGDFWKHTNVIVPRFRSRRMERLWKSLGVPASKVHVLGHGEQLKIGTGVTVTMLLDRSHKEDSALLLDHCGYRFLNLNDCELASSDIPQADAVAAQFSGAHWYPHCYQYDDLTYAWKAGQVRENSATRMFSRFAKSGATTYWPSAGPPAFLDPALRSYNSGEPYGKIFPQWGELQTGFLHKFPKARIGDYLPVTESLDAYSKRRRDEWRAFYSRPDTPATAQEVVEHFQKLHRANSKLLEGYGKDIVLLSPDTWKLRLGTVAEQLEQAFQPEYWIGVPPRVLRAVLDDDCTWEDALSSMRCKLQRQPDQYDFTLMSLLAFGDQPAITSEIARVRDEPPEEFVTKCGFTHQRFCPHAGEDLTDAHVSADAVLTCPRHNWEWDLRTGECISGEGIPLTVKEQP